MKAIIHLTNSDRKPIATSIKQMELIEREGLYWVGFNGVWTHHAPSDIERIEITVKE